MWSTVPLLCARQFGVLCKKPIIPVVLSRRDPEQIRIAVKDPEWYEAV